MAEARLACAACDEHVTVALEHVLAENNHEAVIVRRFKEPDEHFHCWCKKPATWFFRRYVSDAAQRRLGPRTR